MFDQDKKKIVRRYYTNQRRVLEVGCSAGNISAVFKDVDCDFVGIDMDEPVLIFARSHYAKYAHMTFKCLNLIGSAHDLGKFDLIIFNGMCHHVDSDILTELLETAKTLLAESGLIVVSDPIITEDLGWLEQSMIKLDRGHQRRTQVDLVSILSGITGLKVISSEQDKVHISYVRWPSVARYLTVVLGHKD